MSTDYVPGLQIVRNVLASMNKYDVPYKYRRDTVNPAISTFPAVNLFYDADKGILAEDTRGLLVVTNRAAAELFGYEITEMIGKPSEDLVPERFREARKELFKRILEEQIMKELDGIRVNKLGQEIPVQAWVFPYQLNDQLSIAAAIIKR